MRVLTLKIYDKPEGATEPHLAAIASFNENQIVSAVFNVSQREYLVTASGIEGSFASGVKWFTKTEVDPKSKNIVPVKDKFEPLPFGEGNIRPLAIAINDDEQIKMVWEFFNGDAEFKLFEYHDEMVKKIAQAKEDMLQSQELLKQSMNSSGLVDTAGNPLTADNAGKIVSMQKENVNEGLETL